MTFIDCVQCGEFYDPQFGSGENFGLCNDCFDLCLDCKVCGESFNNDANEPLDNCPQCESGK